MRKSDYDGIILLFLSIMKRRGKVRRSYKENQMYLEDFYSIIDYIRGVNEASIILRLILAIICGGMIGAERERAHQAAGRRTYTLVCMGAAMVMLTGEYLHLRYGSGDPARLGAQVVSGIGFLGAGSIIVSRETKIRGLTTAAGLWTSACIGLAVGAGFYSGGIIATMAVYFVITRYKKHGQFHMPDMIGLYAEFSYDIQIHDVIDKIQAYAVDIHEISLENSRPGIKKLNVTFKTHKEFDKVEFAKTVNSFEGLKYSKFLY